jgi:hypothetical protein
MSMNFTCQQREELYIQHNKIYKSSIITDSMEQSPSWETNCCSASQEISSLLWNVKIHYHVERSPLPVPVLSQMNPGMSIRKTVLSESDNLLSGCNNKSSLYRQKSNDAWLCL